MAITPPLTQDDDELNELGNRFARELSSAFGYTLPEAEGHIRDFYLEYERSMPERRLSLQAKGVSTEPMTTADVFWHDGSALVLLIGYRLAGGNPNTLEFLDWRKDCWDALKSGQRVPKPHFYEEALVQRVRAMHAAKAQPAAVVSALRDTIPADVAHERVPVLLKVAVPDLPYDVVREVGELAAEKSLPEARINGVLRPWFQ